MKVLDNSPLPYVPSFMQKPNHLAQRMAVYRKRVAEEQKQADDRRAFTQRMGRPEEWT